MKIKVCKTNEITDKEWEDIIYGFSDSFKRISSITLKKNFYRNNVFGFSYHALALNNAKKVIAHTTVMPFFYNISGKIQKVGLSGGTFVREDYRRDVLLFSKMYDCLRMKCNEEKIIAILGVPNNNSFKYSLKVLKKNHIGYLSYFILPLRVSSLTGRKIPAFLNHLSFLFFRIYSLMLLGISRTFNINEKEINLFINY